MSLWIEEPRLHDASLLLSALPPQYDSERLALIFEGNEVRKAIVIFHEFLLDGNVTTVPFVRRFPINRSTMQFFRFLEKSTVINYFS